MPCKRDVLFLVNVLWDEDIWCIQVWVIGKGFREEWANTIIKVLLLASVYYLKSKYWWKGSQGLLLIYVCFIHSFSEACTDKRAFIRCVFLNENLIRRSCVYNSESSKNMPAAVCKWFSGWMNGLFTHRIKYVVLPAVSAWMGPTVMIYSPSPGQRHRLGNRLWPMTCFQNQSDGDA